MGGGAFFSFIVTAEEPEEPSRRAGTKFNIREKLAGLTDGTKFCVYVFVSAECKGIFM